MGNVLGIDLGASYVKAVYITSSDSGLQPVLNRNSDCIFRVCGVAQPDGLIRTLTKEEDRKLALERGEQLIENVKPLRGEGRDGEALEVAVLKEVLECYREQTHNFDLTTLDRVVLAHPVSPRPASVEALKRIAIEAGLPEAKLDTIEEPVALGFFAKYLRPEVDGQLFVIDAGHYTTDLVSLEFQGDSPVVKSTSYLSLRLGVAEVCHRIGRSLWLKAQMAGGAGTPSESPFDESGPEANQPLVQKLSAWAERDVIRAIGYDFFGADASTSIALTTIERAGAPQLGPWRDKINIVSYLYDLSAAQGEELSLSYPHHNPNMADRIRHENYRETIRPLIRALCAAALGVFLEMSATKGLHIALGGGMSLIPEVRDAVGRLLTSCGLDAPVDLNYEYLGLGPLAVGRLLSIASGSAIAASQRFARVDTLSDTLGMIVSYELEDALYYLDSEHVLPPDFDPASELHLSQLGAKTTPSNVVIVPLHRVLVTRGTELPYEIEFPDDLVVLSAGGTINLTRYGDQNGRLSIVPAAQPGGATIAQIKVPRPENPETPLRLFLKILRNDVWELKIKDPSGRIILKHDVALDLKGRF